MKTLITLIYTLLFSTALYAQNITGFVGTTEEINIAEVFGIPSGFAEYSVDANSNISVANAIIEGDVATVTFNELGQTKLTVSASGSFEATQDVYIAVWPVTNVTDDHIVTFEELPLEEESYWNGSDGSGGFTSENVFFPNTFTDYGTYTSWSGWGYSNVTDNTTPGYGNQFGNITGSGMDTLLQTGEDQFAIAFTGSDKSALQLPKTANEASNPVGVYITNSTYAALSMEEGDGFAKNFGGETGDDEDWFLLTIQGYKDGISKEPVEFYLADFRFEDNSEDYIVKTWQWVDLSSLGITDSIEFSLSSSDVGDRGMNTPATFALDNFIYSTEIISSIFTGTESQTSAVYPNPSSGIFHFNTENAESLLVENMHGQTVYENQSMNGLSQVNLEHLPSGSYIFRVQTAEGLVVSKVMKQ